MNSQKEIRNIKIKNQLELWLFCAIIGAVAGGLVWALLKIMAVGMNLIWEWVPEHFSLPYYTIVVCVIGAFFVGVFRKMFATRYGACTGIDSELPEFDIETIDQETAIMVVTLPMVEVSKPMVRASVRWSMPGSRPTAYSAAYCTGVMPVACVSSRNTATAICCRRRIWKPGRLSISTDMNLGFLPILMRVILGPTLIISVLLMCTRLIDPRQWHNGWRQRQ